MKFFMFVASILVAGNALSLPGSFTNRVGTYSGMGEWKDAQGERTRYTVETTLAETTSSNPEEGSGVTYSSKYKFGEKEMSFSLVVSEKQEGFFTLLQEGDIVVGQGYCFDVQCHIEVPQANLEETLTFAGDKLFKLGSKMVNDKKVIWQEVLTKQ